MPATDRRFDYSLHSSALEILRQRGGLMTMAEALAVAEANGRYVVRCDECKAEIRRTNHLRESAAGGRCDGCR